MNSKEEKFDKKIENPFFISSSNRGISNSHFYYSED